ncbi:hypothetical protein E2C01_082844 [Portunus trituberculatus]|uniref:Uncharacterized protein n=1 Tax=Portunus trituberculatus TaxID=210409 RepID=A0A5B7ITD5_PORTR|nr:hypothetical protein [Portunus trituberculatus]
MHAFVHNLVLIEVVPSTSAKVAAPLRRDHSPSHTPPRLPLTPLGLWGGCQHLKETHYSVSATGRERARRGLICTGSPRSPHSRRAARLDFALRRRLLL